MLKFDPTIATQIFTPETGKNIRVRLDTRDRSIKIKPSTRNARVKGEEGFAIPYGYTFFYTGLPLPNGRYGLLKMKYGWYKLIEESEGVAPTVIVG